MKLSLNWLNEYIDIKDYLKKPQEMAAILTAAGIEVEEIIDRSRPFQNVVLGHILERGQHPGADRLTVCQVSTGGGIVHQIVCGAKNHKQGDRVVVALPGAILPGDFAIKKSAIRGVESAGMLCSESELGLKAESEGILILPENAPIGVSFAEYMKFDDVLFELKVTPNRSDCLSHFGLAREVASLLDREYHLPFKSFSEIDESTKAEVALEVKDPDLCPRYAGRVIHKVKVGPSPDWLKIRLESVGLKSINNVVDVTNYVMMELGQPLHAFDLREITGRKLIVARSTVGETFKTLDGTELKLTGSELTIRDAERPVALAGVVGGLNSGIREDTTDLFIESAYFIQSAVRRTSRAFGFETDSSYRFARGVNPDAVLLALNRACELIEDVAGGQVLGDPHDAYPKPVPRRSIKIKLSDVCSRLGYEVTRADFLSKLEKIECDVKESGGDFEVSPPLYRWDLSIDMDLIEEYSRLNGYDKIPETLPALNYSPTADAKEFLNENQVNETMRRVGFNQAVNFAFVSASDQKKLLGNTSKLNFLKVGEPIKLMNPLSEELDVMRTTLTGPLFSRVSHNIRHGTSVGRLFEIGYVFRKDGENYIQEARLAVAAWGIPETLWQKKGQGSPLVFDIKARLEEAFKALRVTGFRWETLKSLPEFLHPGQCIGLGLRGETIGYLGTLHPKFSDELKFRDACVFAEFNLEKIYQAMKADFKVQAPSKFPAVQRDLAFVVPEKLAVSDVMAEIKKVAGPLLNELSVFDLFVMPDGNRSIAFRMWLQDEAGTLNDEALQGLQQKIIQSLAQKLGIQIR